AVLAQAVGERFDAPLLELADLAAHLLDDAFELGGEFFDLLRAHVLAREEDVFIEWHGMPFPPSIMLHPARSPSSPFGKGSKAQKAGTRDAGPSGPAASLLAGRPSVQLPAGIERRRVYRGFRQKGKADAAGCPAAGLVRGAVALEQRTQALRVRLDDGVECVRPADVRLDPELVEALADVGQRQYRLDVPVEPLDHRAGRAGGDQDAKPGIVGEARHPGLYEGRHVRQL